MSKKARCANRKKTEQSEWTCLVREYAVVSKLEVAMSEILPLTDQHKNLSLRAIVRQANIIGEKEGFDSAADFLWQAHVPQCVAVRVLAHSKHVKPRPRR